MNPDRFRLALVILLAAGLVAAVWLHRYQFSHTGTGITLRHDRFTGRTLMAGPGFAYELPAAPVPPEK